MGAPMMDLFSSATKELDALIAIQSEEGFISEFDRKVWETRIQEAFELIAFGPADASCEYWKQVHKLVGQMSEDYFSDMETFYGSSFSYCRF